MESENQTNSSLDYTNLSTSINSYANEDDIHLIHNSNFDFGIYEELLKDRIITLSFKEAIEKNSEIFKDKIILEIGSSLCLYPSFAIKSGAQNVYSLTENSTLSILSKKIILHNEILHNKLTIISIDTINDISSIKLPVDKVDIIISNWMGLLLLKDSLIYYVMKAREKWLKPEGIILPDKSTIYISSIKSSKHTIRPSISSNFWTSVYDIDMTVIREEVARNVVNTKCDADLILSSISKVYEIDMYTVREEDLSFASKYDLTIEKNDRINSIIAWFDVYFEKIPNKVYFTTSPFNKMTLYKQCVLLMDEEEIVLKGEKLRGSIALKNNIRDPNNFSMFTGIKMSFHFDGKITKKDYIKYFKLK